MIFALFFIHSCRSCFYLFIQIKTVWFIRMIEILTRIGFHITIGRCTKTQTNTHVRSHHTQLITFNLVLHLLVSPIWNTSTITITYGRNANCSNWHLVSVYCIDIDTVAQRHFDLLENLTKLLTNNRTYFVFYNFLVTNNKKTSVKNDMSHPTL